MLKFKEKFIIEKQVSKNEFIEKFKLEFESFEEDFISRFIRQLFWKKGKYELVGILKNDSFKLKRDGTMNSLLNAPTATAKGKIIEKENKTIINLTVNGFIYSLIPFYSFLIIILLGSISQIFDKKNNTLSLFLFCFVTICYLNYIMIRDKNKLKKLLLEKINSIK